MAEPTNISLTGGGLSSAALPYLIAFEHADDIEKNADTLTLHFRNDDGRFSNEWYVPKGSQIQASISSGGITLDCGVFFVDNSIASDPPAIYVVKATSIPVSSNFKSKRGGDAWEKTTFKDLCALLAARSGLGLDYRAKENPKLNRVDEDEESDAVLVRRMATNFGLLVKCTNGKLVVIDEAELDQQAPSFIFGRDITPMLHIEMRTVASNKVSRVESSYLSPETGRAHTEPFDVPDPPEGSQGTTHQENDRPDFPEDPDPDPGQGD